MSGAGRSSATATVGQRVVETRDTEAIKASRRRRAGAMAWKAFSLLEKRCGLPPARVVHSLLSHATNSCDDYKYV